jgi:hypothetical protein
VPSYFLPVDWGSRPSLNISLSADSSRQKRRASF